MKKIKLNDSFSAIVDDDEYDRLLSYTWHARVKKIDGEFTRNRLRQRVEAATTFRVEASDGGYAYRPITMHRLILGAKQGEYVDHINGDPLDNRKENLRIVTNQQNSWNARGAKSMNGNPTSSRFKGVFKKICKTPHGDYEYFVGRIKANGKDITVYHGKDEVAAACHYDYAAQNYFGEYARPNFDGAAYDEWYNATCAND